MRRKPDGRLYQPQVVALRQIFEVCDKSSRIRSIQFALEEIKIAQHSPQSVVATDLAQMGWKMPQTVRRNVREATLVFSPTPVRQSDPALLQIYVVRSGKWLVVPRIPAR